MRRVRRRAHRLLNAVLIVCVQACVVEASQQGSFAVPVRRTPAARRERLLQEANAPATANATAIRVRQMYSVVSVVFMTLTLAGGQQFELEVDTGSVPTYLPCKGCTRERCGSHLHQYYDYDRSSDFERLNCSSRAEDAALCTAIHRADCQSDGTCGYSVHYLDNGSSVGYVARDTFFFDGAIADTTLAFGCETAAENGILTSKKDGLVGFGHGVYTLHAQLAKAGAINGNTFGICGEGFDSTLGLITLGKFDFGGGLPPLGQTPLLRNRRQDLVVRAHHWKLGDIIIASSSSVDTVLDSGTTFTYVPSAMYADFKQRLETAVNASGLRRVDGHGSYSVDPDEDICFGGTRALNAHTLSKWFPTLTIVYQPNVTLYLQPENYVYRHRTDRHAFCLGIFDGQKDHASSSGNVWWGILLGQLTLRDTFVEFDIDNYQVGMAATNCAALRKKYTKALPSGSGDFPVFVTTSLLQLLVAVGAGLLVWLLAWLLAWGMRLAIRRARTKRGRMGWRRLEDELDTQIEMGDMTWSCDIEKR